MRQFGGLAPPAREIAHQGLQGVALLGFDLVGLQQLAERRGQRAAGGARRLVQHLQGALAEAALGHVRSEEHTSELQSLMRISYAVFCLKKKKHKRKTSAAEKCSDSNQCEK